MNAVSLRRFSGKRPKGAGTPDKEVQRFFGPSQPDPAGLDIEGIGFAESSCSCAPPDTDGQVGETQYVQWVNTDFEVFDKATGASVLGPVPGNALWSGFGGPCEESNSGDIIVRYDAEARSWIFMQPVFDSSIDGEFHMCFGVSVGSDATGAYNLYDFGVGAEVFPDYPKVGIWPDGYYMTVNQFDQSNTFAGLGAYAFDRQAMLAGSDASFLYFNVGVPFGGVLPADWDGDGAATGLAPPPGAPNSFLGFDCTACDGTDGLLHVWRFHADFDTPANATFEGPTDIATAPFNILGCTFAGERSCVPQLGTSDGLDAIGDRLMYRAAYRNFGDHEAVVLNHTVNAASDGDHAGIRWYEVRNPGGTPTIFQQGTYAPDSSWRWMGSLAMDVSGNIALGYSKSSASIYPEIALTGRLATEPPGTLGSEALMHAGSGSQTDTDGRWGDYSAMSVDPTDGCTFWYTQEYYQTTGEFDWHTRIASFRFPGCTKGPAGILQGTVTDESTGDPIAQARVTADATRTTTDAAGLYRLALPPGSYDVTASRYGFLAESATKVAVTEGGTTTQNFALDAAPAVLVDGVVRDGSGADWPLYATVKIAAPGFSGVTVYTDPVTGYYSAPLFGGTTYTFSFDAESPGYEAESRTVSTALPTSAPGGQIESARLTVDPASCSAPGYQSEGTDCAPRPGGLVVGNVRDANTGFGLNGATVLNLPQDGSTTSFATPDDVSQGDGLYILFAESGPQPFRASLYLYADDSRTATVIPSGAVRRDFSLKAGRLSGTPSALTMKLDPGQKGELTLKLTNEGGRGASFRLDEINFPPPAPGLPPQGPYADPAAIRQARARIPSGITSARDTRGFGPLLGSPVAAPLPAGKVLNSYPTGLSSGWGIGFDTQAIPNDFWVSNLAGNGGDDRDYRYLTDGTRTGDTIDVSPWVGAFAADMAYDAITGKLWEVNVGGDQCIHELDPVARRSTPRKICPAFASSQRGLAFDPENRTFYSGSFEDGVINHFDESGTILDSNSVSLAVSGLAYNSATHHLFVLQNVGNPSFGGFDVYVLDTKADYRVLGAFFIKRDGVPAIADFGGAGLEIDCNGHLWLVDQTSQTIHEADSGERGVCDFQEIPWLSESPKSGEVPSKSSTEATLTFDATGLTSGLRQADLVAATDTPYGVLDFPVNLVVRFLDVSDSDPFAPFIYGLAGASVTSGCGSHNYCPEDPVTRAQMAVLLERAAHGASFFPPPATGLFGDVPPGSFGAAYIEQLFKDGITAGCGGGNFCPDNEVTRAQAAVFIVKAEHGATFVPPPATGVFRDVPPDSFGAAYIEQLAREGITAGCGGGDFCPQGAVSRGQLAVLLVRAFGLPYLR